MADKAATIRTRKFMTNKLLQRRQFVSPSPGVVLRGGWGLAGGAHRLVSLTWQLGYLSQRGKGMGETMPEQYTSIMHIWLGSCLRRSQAHNARTSMWQVPVLPAA